MIGPIQAFEGIRAIVRIVLDPTQLDEVFVLADLSEESEQLHRLVDELHADPAYAPILRDKPRLGAVDLDRLSQLPEGTVGREYARFMRERGLEHENLTLVDGERDIDWLRNHMRETHDLWHVATGFDTDVAGELGLQAFYLAQFHGPLPLLLLAIGMVNTLFREIDDSDRRMNAIARGWLLGRRSRPLFGLAWAERWEQPLEELRREHGLNLARVDAILAEVEPERALSEAA